MTEANSILIVCRANVCRSALAELTFAEMLPPAAGVSVSSAGISAPVGSPICELVAEWAASESWHARAAKHRARVLSEELVEQADLVLTASTLIRGEVTRVLPAARNRVFTLIEAAELGDGFNRSATSMSTLKSYVDYLDHQRFLAPPAATAPRFGRRRQADALGIADNHGRRDRDHRATLQQVTTAVRTIIEQLGEN